MAQEYKKMEKPCESVGNLPKPLLCLFLLDVLCSFRKSEKVFGIMDRCLKCKHYLEFLKEMAEEDEKVMDEIDEMRRFHGEKV